MNRTLFYFLLLVLPFSVYSQNSAYMSASVQWVNCGDVDLAGTQLTVEALIHMTGPSVNIVSKHTDPSNVNYLLRTGGFEITTTNGYSSVGNSYPLSQNVTYHVAATYDGATLNYYVNGCLTGTTAWSGNLVTQDLLTAIGQQSVCQCEQFIGYIDEVRLWNVARTQAEIQANMATLPSPATQPGLVAYYEFNNSYINSQGNTLYNGTSQAATLANIPAPLPTVITGAATATNISCFGSSNGSISITGSGGLTPYTFSIDGINYQASNIFSNLPAGSYTAYVKSNNSCIATTNVTVSEPALLSAAITGATNANCNGSATGAASVTPSGGTSPYTYSWNTVPAQLNQTATALAAGTYSVTVNDANGCSQTNGVVITEPTPLTAVISDTVNVSCSGGNDGSATVSASGGNGTYSYTWNTVPVQTASTAISLSAGTYTVTVVDGSCSASGIELITNGDFNSGNSGFSSSYGYCNTNNCLFPEATYGVGSDPFFFHNGFAGADHTTGSTNMMVINGAAAANTNVWCQTVPVNPNTEYLFSTWVTSVSAGSPAQLQFSFNGVITGSIFNAPSTVGAWDQFFSTWNSGTNTSVDICIVNQNTLLGGNDFGLDDISFQQCAPSCSTTVAVVIQEPLPLTANVTTDSASCAGSSDGSAAVLVSGGVTPYTYSWNTIPATSSTISSVAGTYTATISDANGCAISTQAIIEEPQLLSAVITSQTDASCAGIPDGTATVSVTGGTGAYTYSWNTVPSQSTPTSSSLSAGTYTVMITDGNGCDTSTTAIINEPQQLVASVSLVSDVTCTGNSDGVISASASGGTLPYIYTWSNGASGQTNSQAAVGLHYVLVMDSAGCYDTASVYVNEPAPLVIADSSKNVTCFGLADGEISLTISGGTPAYTYSWSNGATTPVASSLSAGTYTANVTDANSCLITGSFIITEPVQLSVITAAFDATCAGSCNGQVVAIIQGGTTPYSYSWTDTTITGAAGVDLCAGVYCVTAFDNNGCSQFICDTVFEPLPLTFNSGSFTAHCDKSDGTAYTTVAGGTLPYTYSWSNGQSSDTAFSVPGGNHIITVTDSYNCVSSDTVIVGNAPGVVASMQSSVSAICKDSCNGSASVFASGSSGPYLYSWNTIPIQSSDTAKNLCAGVYDVVVIDAYGCSDTVSFNIGEPSKVETQATDPSTICIGQSAVLTASASGGSGGYSYSWTPSTALSDTTGSTVQSSAVTTTTYTVQVNDGNGCVADPEDVIVTVYPSLSVSASQNDSICLGRSANISAAASGGNGGPYSYSWTPAAGLTSSATASSTASPIVTTRYYVIVSDGCTVLPAVDSVDIKVMPLPIVTFTPLTRQGCYPVEVSFENTTGSTASLSWDFGDGSTSGSSSPVHVYTEPGTYHVSLVVSDFNGCTDSLEVQNAVEVYDHPQADFIYGPDDVTILDPRIQFTDQSTGVINEWLWSTDTTAFSINQHVVHTFADTGSYAVNLFVTDEHGCVDDTTMMIYIADDHTFYLPNAFSPNGDGINDTFGPDGIGISLEDYTFHIYDRWGNLTFNTTDPSKRWDGKSGGSSAINDVYVWKVKVKNVNTNTVKNYRGTVTIVK